MTAPRANFRPDSALLVAITGLLAAALLQTIFPAPVAAPEVRVTFDADAAGTPPDVPAQPLFPGLPPAS